MTISLGIDAGQHDRTECEHLLARAVALCGAVQLACTHVVSAHWAASLRVAGPAPDAAELSRALGVAVWLDGAGAGPREWREGARAAERQVRAGTGGRAVVFLGQERLVGVVAVDDVPALSAVARVRGIAGIPTAGMQLHTRDFVRPELLDGELVLTVRPWGADGDLAPFEVPNPTPCCAVHA